MRCGRRYSLVGWRERAHTPHPTRVTAKRWTTMRPADSRARSRNAPSPGRDPHARSSHASVIGQGTSAATDFGGAATGPARARDARASVTAREKHALSQVGKLNDNSARGRHRVAALLTARSRATRSRQTDVRHRSTRRSPDSPGLRAAARPPRAVALCDATTDSEWSPSHDASRDRDGPMRLPRRGALRRRPRGATTEITSRGPRLLAR